MMHSYQICRGLGGGEPEILGIYVCVRVIGHDSFICDMIHSCQMCRGLGGGEPEIVGIRVCV